MRKDDVKGAGFGMDAQKNSCWVGDWLTADCDKAWSRPEQDNTIQ